MRRVCLIALLLLACGAPEPGRVLIVGIDGASPRLLEPMLRAGRLPNFDRLVREGTWGWFRTHVRPIESPVVWTSIATGKRPGRHGILGFLRATGKGRHLHDSRDRRAHALWNIASGAGLRVGVVNWWTTFPPELVNGVMISDHALPDAMRKMVDFVGAEPVETHGVIAHPKAWIERTHQLMAAPAPEGVLPNPFEVDSTLPDQIYFNALGSHYTNDVRILNVALGLEAEEDPDVLMLLLVGVDRVCHFLWRYMEPDYDYPVRLRPRAEDVPKGRALLERYIEVTDSFLGLLLERFDLDRDLVIVLSDHGFEAGTSPALPTTGAHESARAEVGVLFLAGAGVGAGGREDSATTLDITPTVLTWLGLPVGVDMDGRPLTEFFPGKARFESPPPPITTHDRGVILRVPVVESGSEEAIEEQLRSLGYIE